MPESKQHMVLHELEEEDEHDDDRSSARRHSKLSLTSLLLGESKRLMLLLARVKSGQRYG